MDMARSGGTTQEIIYREDGLVDRAQTLALYRSQAWAAAEKPEKLLAGLEGSSALVTAWNGESLVGVGNAISDGHLVVYFPHLLVAREYRSRGVGREIMARLMRRYEGFHQQVVLADAEAADFFRRCGFGKAGSTVPLWLYDGSDHD